MLKPLHLSCVLAGALALSLLAADPKPDDPAAIAVNALVKSMHANKSNRNDPQNWRTIFRDAELLNPENAKNNLPWLFEHTFRLKEFIPDVRTFIQNENAPPRARSLAVHALHEMGDDSLRDYVYDDLVSAKPQLDGWAWKTLGDFKLPERTQALLELCRDEKNESAAARLSDFGAAGSAVLIELLGEPAKLHNCFRDVSLLYALTLADKDAAFKYVEYLIEHPDPAHQIDSYHRESFALDYLARIDTPKARQLAIRHMNKLSGRELNGFLQHIDTGYHPRGDSTVERCMPRTPAVAQALFPHMLDWLIAHPDDQIGASAMRQILRRITGVPKAEKDIMNPTKEKALALIAEWSALVPQEKK